MNWKWKKMEKKLKDKRKEKNTKELADWTGRDQVDKRTTRNNDNNNNNNKKKEKF
ncbi:hypothetical protein PP707_01825 [Acetobacter pasteurianus]|nr:hypothetical protein [Acetobacter pasteurianus]